MTFGEIDTIFGYDLGCEKQNIVSFSLWGNNPKYALGAIENARLCKLMYKNWIARFYCGKDVDINIIHNLKNNGAQVFVMKDIGSWNGMFWRFFPASEKNVARFLSRDADSRVSLREVLACEKWIEQDTDFLILRDHPYHAVPILGGMWGCKGNVIQDIKNKITQWNKTDEWQTDQDFLKKIIAPTVKSATIFDPFFSKIPFPSERIGDEFVGEAFDENGLPNQEHRAVLRQFEKR